MNERRRNKREREMSVCGLPSSSGTPHLQPKRRKRKRRRKKLDRERGNR